MTAQSEFGPDQAARIRDGSVFDQTGLARLLDRSVTERPMKDLPDAAFLKRLNQRSELTETRMKAIQRRGEPIPLRPAESGAAFLKQIQKRSDPANWTALTRSLESSTMGKSAQDQLQVRSLYDSAQLDRIHQLSIGTGKR